MQCLATFTLGPLHVILRLFLGDVMGRVYYSCILYHIIHSTVHFVSYAVQLQYYLLVHVITCLLYTSDAADE